MRASTFGMVGLGACLLAGCRRGNEVSWFAQNASPDGTWIAMAHTENTPGGFGTGAEWTVVEVKQNIASGKTVEVLQVEEGVQDLRMNWKPGNHLVVTYRRTPHILFQAVKAFGNDVTVEKETTPSKES